MDNLTHTLTGLAAGELIHRILPPESAAGEHGLRRRLLLISCALASNFPDLDLIFSPLLPAPLGYLLHHRGHTHTFLYAIPQALLAALLCLLWPSARRLLAHSSTSRAGLGVALATGLVLHILMDYLNSYGVHPFHPFDSRWLYGDMVFILEPLFWVAFGMPMIMTVRGRELKAVLAAILTGILLFFTVTGFLAWPSFAVLLGLALALGCAQYRAEAGGIGGLMSGLLAAAGFVAIQGVATWQAERAIGAYAHERDPASRVLDVSLSAFPSNPLCWSFVSIETSRQSGLYRLRRGIASIAPDAAPVADCPSSLAETARQKPAVHGIAILSEEPGDLQMLRRLSRTDCHFNAWLRFARMPSIGPSAATDVRFAATPRGNFTTIKFEDFKNLECSRYIPQWDFPRADLLQ